jgi:NAD(P)-dependent dehydrogenase (short-subunit alcohol dehydrogenase family)
MKDFGGRLAVVTGGGSGIGRELARQLVAQNCHVAICDVSTSAMSETRAICERDAPQGARITAHVADVSDERQVQSLRDEVAHQHDTDKLNLLFNNAGIGGGGSIFTDDRAAWEKTFNVCWGGVYLGTRAFLPMLMAADEAHIVNTSSVNGFWAAVRPNVPHTAYSAAKFAVKGFTEALINDLRVNAPHIKCSVVMPGHIGTALVSNTRKIQNSADTDELTASDLRQARVRIAALGIDASKLSDDDVRKLVVDRTRKFLEEAPTTAEAAAATILEGVKAERWRILVGKDAHRLDQMVRAAPDIAYTDEFFEEFVKEAGWIL